MPQNDALIAYHRHRGRVNRPKEPRSRDSQLALGGAHKGFGSLDRGSKVCIAWHGGSDRLCECQDTCEFCSRNMPTRGCAA